MTPLNRKLVRDLWRLRGQIIAIAMVVGSGVGVLVMSLSNHEALTNTAQAYYERYRFADVFTRVKRAPEKLAARIADIPGVQTVETRITRFATLEVRGFAEPVIGQLVSIPERGEPALNRLALRAGRSVAPGRPDEVVLSEPFAQAHELKPGDSLQALMNGKKRTLQIVGIALSPEFVHAIAPGALMPDDERYGILWMGREALAAAYDLDGAFNDVSLTLLRGTAAEPVIERLDQLLDRHGSVGAVARAQQLSNWFLMNDIEQLESMSRILPTIFLIVAAFLTNIVLARLIATERSEIGLMKAFGYSNVQVGWHYTKLVIAMTIVGIALGWVVGAWLGRVSTQVYAEFYRFPLLIFRPSPSAFVLGALVSLAAALAGTISAVHRAATLPPAEAMRPPAPLMYRHARFGSTRLGKWLDQPTRIIFRQIGRRPVRSALTSIGIAFSIAILVMAMQWLDSIDHIVRVYFFEAQRQDMTVGLVEPQSSKAMHEFRRLPGVLAAEPMRIVSADLRAGSQTHRGAIDGVQPDARLQLVRDVSGEILRVPPEGLVLGTKLAQKLRVGVGDAVWVDVLEGRRPLRQVPVVGLVETYLGMPAYMNINALSRMLRERPSVGYVNLLVDQNQESELFKRLKELPDVAAVTLRRAAEETFHDTMGETLMIYVSFFTAFAGALGFGVAYNSARIALSERGRELATLRVLGFTRLETSYILLGEIALLIFVGLPLGCLAGRGLAWIMTSEFETELFRVPLFIEASTYGAAVVVALVATVLSAALVRSRLDHLDLIRVLKTRE
ncbi:MAG: FtsX-like permease family protein [Gammaproteobacteria bacterium]